MLDDLNGSQSAEQTETFEPWRGLTWGGYAGRVEERVRVANAGLAKHRAGEARWERWVAPLAWLTAVLAALSGVSVLADYGLAAVVLSVTTAVVAGTNAALHPAETAKKHRAAVNGYGRIARKLDDAAWFETKQHDQLVPEDRLNALREELQSFDDEIKAIEDQF